MAVDGHGDSSASTEMRTGSFRLPARADFPVKSRTWPLSTVSTPPDFAHSFYPRKGGGSWSSKNSTKTHFFRADEQAPQGLPVGEKSEAWRPHRPRQQGAIREVGQKRSLSVHVGKTIQEMLSEKRLLSTV